MLQIEQEEISRLQDRYVLRAKAVNICRFFIYVFLFFYATRLHLEFLLVLLFCVTLSVASHVELKNSILGRRLYFISLLLDVSCVAFFLFETKGILSPLMMFQPMYAVFFTLSSPNSILILPPLLLVPIATFVALQTGAHVDGVVIEYIFLYFIACASGIFLTHHVLGKEEAQSRKIFELEKKTQALLVLEERNRLSRDIHDGIGASLSGLIMQAEYLLLLSKGHDVIEKEVKELKLSAEEAIEEIRRCVQMMRDDFDLVTQIQNMCYHFEIRQKIPVQVKIIGVPPKLPHEEQLMIFRIMQEALTNVSKHAHASHVCVTLFFSHGGYRVTIQDNGSGFQVGENKKFHYGLTGMRERAQKIGAHMNIVSKINVGTTISLEFGD